MEIFSGFTHIWSTGDALLSLMLWSYMDRNQQLLEPSRSQDVFRWDGAVREAQGVRRWANRSLISGWKQHPSVRSCAIISLHQIMTAAQRQTAAVMQMKLLLMADGVIGRWGVTSRQRHGHLCPSSIGVTMSFRSFTNEQPWRLR